MTKLLLLCLVLSFSIYADAQGAKYKRKEWKHWIDADHDCQNSRQEILIARSESEVIMNKNGCTVQNGLWLDYYYPQRFTRAQLVDIDHLIPLKHAYLTGGKDWTALQRMTFANDPENLVITSKKYNRSKGSKSIDRWLPVNVEYACKYVKDWMRLKQKYHLRVTALEHQTVESLKSKCL